MSTDFQAQDIALFRQVLVRLNRRLRKHSADGELTPSQASAVATVGRHGGMRVGELARREAISKSSATRVAARLERLGLFSRFVDPLDQRTYGVVLTPAAKTYLAKVERSAEDLLAQQLVALSTDERRRLLAALPVLEKLATVRW
ncbi:MarR family winged helix-turn-helix transcriptional regulator [Nocardioides halotolerans]|uniref:MarR family winged helix-turn-helix transcriptional regulator n=1 Tax=Nocardioides halotolerans TaxID=433660 RepID=UPI00040367A5|nr:MarR family transcriptional regulator [Nocardioides halotolerans]